MRFLHSCKNAVVHRDLKPQNVLLDEYMVAKIADFGICRKAETHNATTRPLGNSVGEVLRGYGGKEWDSVSFASRLLCIFHR